MHQSVKVNQWLSAAKLGTEIGAFKTPLPGITPIYIDKYAVYANERCLADYAGEATELPFKTNSLDYIASSHVLEHVANPIKAFVEWHRVLRPDGLIYMIVPDRRYTWDHQRALTTTDHFFKDFAADMSPVDGTHIDDFVDKIDWSTYSPSTPPEKVDAAKQQLKKVYWDAVRSKNEINIHFHVFEPSNLRELIEKVGESSATGIRWELVDLVERFPDENPNGILAVIRVKKSVKDRLLSFTSRPARESAVLTTAKKFD